MPVPGFPEAVAKVRGALAGDAYWARHPAFTGRPGLHLAIFIEPYLSLLLSGEKTVESRFASRRVAPWRSVAAGDVLLLKRSSGPVVGVCEVAKADYFELNAAVWREIDRRYRKSLALVGNDFAELRRSDLLYATLLTVDHVRSIAPVPFPKKDRRGWVVLDAAPTRVADR